MLNKIYNFKLKQNLSNKPCSGSKESKNELKSRGFKPESLWDTYLRNQRYSQRARLKQRVLKALAQFMVIKALMTSQIRKFNFGSGTDVMINFIIVISYNVFQAFKWSKIA